MVKIERQKENQFKFIVHLGTVTTINHQLTHVLEFFTCDGAKETQIYVVTEVNIMD